MFESTPPLDRDDLQFDRAIPATSSGDAPASDGMVCSACHHPIADEYYDINGQAMCQRSRRPISSATRGIRPSCGRTRSTGGTLGEQANREAGYVERSLV